MASYYAIAAVTAALQGLLADARPPEYASAEIAVLQVTDFQKAKPVEEGISILLYRIMVSALPRTLSYQVDALGRRRLPPLPVDLCYLFTPWGKTAAAQQRLLGWLMRTLEDSTNLNAGLLNHFGGPDLVFGEDETITLTPETLPLAELANLWDVLKPNAHVSVAYIARMVHLETLIEPASGEPVQTREFQYAGVPR